MPAAKTPAYLLLTQESLLGCAGFTPPQDSCNLWETDDVPEPKEVLSHTGSAFYALLLKGTHRVAHLCKAPQLLACWALELLEEQAVNVSPRIAALLPDALLSLTLRAPAYAFTNTYTKAAWCQAAGVHLC